MINWNIIEYIVIYTNHNFYINFKILWIDYEYMTISYDEIYTI